MPGTSRVSIFPKWVHRELRQLPSNSDGIGRPLSMMLTGTFPSAPGLRAAEIGLAVASTTQILFGCRLQCVSRGERPPFLPSIPGVVRQIVRNLTCQVDGRSVTESVWRIERRRRRRPCYTSSAPLSPASGTGCCTTVTGWGLNHRRGCASTRHSRDGPRSEVNAGSEL